MLKSYEAIYDHGNIQWLSEPPKVEHFKMLVVIEQPESENNLEHLKQRMPPPELKGSIKWLDDPLTSVISETEWNASLARTARQFAGDPEAFK
ncbi:MAG: hypothetical protein HOP02_02410 [Methylococcaceae bacterium]|nr:hypothetical protein [Methylococcaceae bacterium]